MASILVSRNVIKKVLAIERAEGVGARVRRSIGTRELRNLSPFLMLDHFRVDEGAGFPDHPHRGMVTVTYMLQGFSQHEDFAGHKGTIGPGDLQWMSAGRGIMHAEMPQHRDAHGEKLPDPVGLQLWIDLPKKNKMDKPSYQEYPKEKVTTAVPRTDQPEEDEGSDWEIKVIAGTSHGVTSPVRSPKDGACWYFDVTIHKSGSHVFQEIPPGFNAFVYTMGPANIKVGSDPSSKSHEPYHTLVLSNQSGEENGVKVTHDGKKNEKARFVIIAGQPLNQSVVQFGPFVLCTQEEAKKTMLDFQLAKNGFERAAGWKSKIAETMKRRT